MTDGPPALLLDEMHHPKVAARLRERGFNVVSVAENAEQRAATDAELFRWAAEQGRWIVTENVKDFRRLLVRAEEAGGPCAHMLFTTAHAFPRSRQNLGPLISALEKWLDGGHAFATGYEDWLIP